MPRVPQAGSTRHPDLSLENYAGTYERLGVHYDVAIEDARLVLRARRSGALAELAGDQEEPPVRLLPVNRESFVTADGETLVNFLEFRGKGGPATCSAGRVARRVRPARETKSHHRPRRRRPKP